MGFNPPVPQQDSNWEIRAAVLLSLLFQVLLIFLGPTRKRSSAPLFRLTVWSCYLLADWVADLALGLLLSNLGNIGGNNDDNNATAGSSSSSSSPVIFAFWTPFLLLHLGGPDTITAYSMEDNELWNRHLIGLLFELFSACVIFGCSVHGNPMIPATVLMFVVGTIKYGERTYSLYSGRVENLRGAPDPGRNYSKLMTELDYKKKAGLVVEIDTANGEANKDIVKVDISNVEAKQANNKEMKSQEAKRLQLDSNKSVEAQAYEFFLIFRLLLVDVTPSFEQQEQSQAFFLEQTPKEAFEVIEVELNFIYDMVYTKAPVAYNSRGWGWVLRCTCSACLVSALLIFFFLDKPGHQILRVDIAITYALLLGGLALDVAALLMIFFSDRARVYLEESSWCWWPRLLRWLASLRKAAKWWKPRRWSGKTSQLNLITHSLGKPAGQGACCSLCLVKLAECLGIGDIVDDFVFIRRVWINKRDESKFCSWLRGIGKRVREKLIKPLVPRCCHKTGVHEEDDKTDESPRLLEFIFDGLKLKASAEKLEHKKENLEVCISPGKGVIDRLEKEIMASLRNDDKAERHGNMDDDINDINAEIAEDKFKVIVDSMVHNDFDESLLLWHIATDLCRRKDRLSAPTKDTLRFRAIAETLSEYMLYLLIKQPDMLAATAGIGLLRYGDTCEEARRFFGSMEAWIDGHNDACRMLLSVNTSEKPSVVKGDRSKSALFDGIILAKALRELDEELMWEVITGVWGEMLTYAAAKSRRSMHVRQLSRGGDLITLVWFLMVHMGLGDMYQERDAKAKLIVKDQ